MEDSFHGLEDTAFWYQCLRLNVLLLLCIFPGYGFSFYILRWYMYDVMFYMSSWQYKNHPRRDSRPGIIFTICMWACLWCFGLTINWQGSLWIAPFHMAWLEFYKSKESYLSIRWQKLSKDMCIYSLFVNVEVMLFVPFLTCSQ